jgi:peptidoglycan/xylan/chitin deacetylase (PgdA/CDA1 family)
MEIYTLCTILAGVLFFPLVTGGGALLLFGRKRRPDSPPSAILIHSVIPAPNNGFSYISVDTWNKLASYFREHGIETLTVQQAAFRDDIQPAGRPKNAVITFDDGFENFYHHVFPTLAGTTLRITLFQVVACIGRIGEWDSFGNRKHLSKSQLREISAAGHEIGSHTMTHPDLTFLGEKELEYELSRSKTDLEDITGVEVKSISFPFGQWNRRVWNAALAAGYTAASVYGHSKHVSPPLISAHALYSFDSFEDIVEKWKNRHYFSLARCRSKVMPHFAKGTPAWKWKKEYRLFLR